MGSRITAQAPNGEDGNPSSVASDFHIELFDPDDNLFDLMDGLPELFRDDFETIYWKQVEILRLDPALAGVTSPEAGKLGVATGVAHCANRVTPPLTNSFYKFVTNFGEMIVD